MNIQKSIFAIAGLLVLTCIAPANANDTVRAGLEARGDVSQFLQLLQETKVIDELKPGRRYTVFAPTDSVMRRLVKRDYPCLHTRACKREIANLLRNHIVPGEVHVDEAVLQKATLFAINNRDLRVGQPNKGTYTVDGERILSSNLTPSGIIYRIDGLIANRKELASLRQNQIIVDADPVTLNNLPGEREVVTDQVYYSPTGRKDGVSETIYVTVPATPAPAR